MNRTNTKKTFGFHRKFLRVDLTSRTSEILPIHEDVLRAFLGGSGLGTYLLHHENSSKLHADPLDLEAPLIFTFSSLVGSPLTTSAKFAVVSRSPLTGRINDSLASSQFAIRGKRAGIDAIVIVGRCESLSVLVIDNGEPIAIGRLECCASLR